MKNLMINAFGDLVERTDYGNHKNQLNLFDNLNEIVEENRTADNISADDKIERYWDDPEGDEI